MSAQIIELLIFAGVAFFIINRLIATLGTTSEDDPAKHKSSFFGETAIRDVTYTAKTATSGIFKKNTPQVSPFPINPMEFDGLIVDENSVDIIAGIQAISAKLPSFQARKFLHSAKAAFELIIEASNDDDIEDLLTLVDKRYIKEFHIFSETYGEFVHGSTLDAKISEAYTFANNIFIKVLFTGKKITSKIKNMQEEWTFSRSLISKNTDWFLTNVTRQTAEGQPTF
ncbi:Tim44 domain-containing protein [Candidatus Tisiphia endosymbiont of Hybos culiciformis]|uniref:Tim44 domain-containing protein n=1 Tax=Candidatus Tisiphia endosymbiont of Hybos culiciformis TaxID=3139331 RepID=UPI003CCB4F41